MMQRESRAQLVVRLRHPALGSVRGAVRARGLASTALVALAWAPMWTPVAVAGPEGGIVIGGSAEIVTQGRQTTIEQASDRALIEWRDFDIAPDEGVTFRQPSAASIALNRVKSVDPTVIRGQLNANGQVWVVNRNGVHIGEGASVDVGGLIATTADITDAAFMAGEDRFDIPGSPDAAVVNEGRITFGEAGLVG
ncbi:MAG: filamentous hemagglutinin N-terminal domain-containing protein, partial [Pseudomonadota bacterium]